MPDIPAIPSVRQPLVALLILASPSAAGCDRIGDDSAVAEAPAVEAAAEPGDDSAELPPSEPLPERIYFTLTDYGWYARGEPLVHGDATYRTGGGVIAAPTSAMRKVGEYQGVDVYTAEGSTSDTAVYVPVFPGYWQPFHLAEAAAPAASGS
jgi:hypothetical protein